MTVDQEKDIVLPGPSEFRKRRREILFVVLISILLLLLTWFELRLFGISQQLPFVHSIFFFGLVNFNIILLLLLLFLIFRNVVKVFVERKGKVIGSSLRGKLVAAFVAFSFIPTALMFIISVFYINSSFDKWFSVKMGGVLKSSIEVTNAYYFNAKKKNYHFAYQVAKAIRRDSPPKVITEQLRQLRKSYSLDAVEYYPGLFDERIVVLPEDKSVPMVPALSIEFLQKGIKSKEEASTIHQFGEGNLVRVIVPVSEKEEAGAIVVSSYVPLSLMSKMNDISAAYEDFRDVNPLEYPLKSIYSTILFLMTLVILLAATWFGFYLAKQLSIPLVLLGRAARRIAHGDYARVDLNSGSEEMQSLISSFNQMSSNLERSEIEVREANSNLQSTLESLDKHSRYVEVVLSNVSAGVISVDQEGHVTTINQHASHLLKIDAGKYIGRPVRELLSREYLKTFLDLLRAMHDHNVSSLRKEIRITVEGEAIPISLTLSILKDEKGQELGKVLVFDDLSMIVNAQRAAAWTEVARRIAHEIKNPLTPIKLSAERLQRKFGSNITDPVFSECTTMIIRQTDELKNLVNEFSQFARLPQAKLVPGSLNRVIDESLVLFKSGHAQHHIEFLADRSLPDFKFDPEQMRRVLFNLLDNAIAALPSETQGEIIVSTVYDPQHKIVKLCVADTGTGISAENRSRIFEPYFSTKESGTGLGLPIVKRIIEDHNGFIRALSNEPRGTRMLIEMPVVESSDWKPGEKET